ncbi:MAG: drug/metabolite transporter (DMT)-like permease [Gammaproteobacteria bacterium]|jgi:drug/metabolite transporter (DMT)-like permease
METWILFTIGAAFFQNLRSALQKHLKGKLSTLGASYVRFIYALPIAFIYCMVILQQDNAPIPKISDWFLIYATLGGLCQIVFTILLLWLFSFHNFAVGTTFSKLEVIMVAIFGLFLLDDQLTSQTVVAISISSLGLVVLTMGQSRLSLQNIWIGLWRPSTLIGLSCAAVLGASVVFFRAASLTLQTDQYLTASSMTLVIVLIIQTVTMGGFMLIRHRDELKLVFIHWRQASMVGICGALTSIGWFTAFTLENATHVRALGQVELLFTFIATILFFKEKVSKPEMLGILMITVSIIILLTGY